MEILRESSIPFFAKDSLHLQALLRHGSFPEEGILVPKGCAKEDLSINNAAHLVELLQTFRFWKMPELLETCNDFLPFAFAAENISIVRQCAAEYGEIIPFMNKVYTIVSAGTWNDNTLYAAAANGSLTCLKYLIKNNCPRWTHRKVFNLMLYAASESGHLHIIEYLWLEHSTLLNVLSEKSVGLVAAQKGHVHILEFMRAQSFEYFTTPTSSNPLFCNANVRALEYLYSVGQIPGTMSIYYAAMREDVG